MQRAIASLRGQLRRKLQRRARVVNTPPEEESASLPQSLIGVEELSVPSTNDRLQAQALISTFSNPWKICRKPAQLGQQQVPCIGWNNLVCLEQGPSRLQNEQQIPAIEWTNSSCPEQEEYQKPSEDGYITCWTVDENGHFVLEERKFSDIEEDFNVGQARETFPLPADASAETALRQEPIAPNPGGVGETQPLLPPLPLLPASVASTPRPPTCRESSEQFSLKTFVQECGLDSTFNASISQSTLQDLAGLFENHSEPGATNGPVTVHNAASSAERDNKLRQQLTSAALCPVFLEDWQTHVTIDEYGGSLQKPGSQVLLHVPPGAIDQGSSVKIWSAICTDEELIEEFLPLSEDERIVTPMAEYHTGSKTKFRKPLHIQMKHCLPSNPDMSCVRVYCVASDGRSVTRVPHKSARRGTSTHQFGILGPRGSSGGRRGPDLSQLEEATSEDETAWDRSSYFELTSQGYVWISVEHFSGYTCTYCRKNQDPELYAILSGNFMPKPDSHWLANVNIHIWDKRLTISDFRQELCKNEEAISEPKETELLDEFNGNSLLCVSLCVGAKEGRLWDHVKDNLSEPSLALEKSFELKKLIQCKREKCGKGKQRNAKTKEWSLETTASGVNPWLHLVVKLAHVKEGTAPQWKHMPGSEALTEVKLQMTREVHGKEKMADDVVQILNPSEEDSESSLTSAGGLFHGRPHFQRRLSEISAGSSSILGSVNSAGSPFHADASSGHTNDLFQDLKWRPAIQQLQQSSSDMNTSYSTIRGRSLNSVSDSSILSRNCNINRLSASSSSE